MLRLRRRLPRRAEIRLMPTVMETRKIFAGAREIGITEEQLRDLVEQVSNQRSVRQLTRTETGRLIDLLVQAGVRPAAAPAKKRSGRRVPAGVLKMITPGQRGQITWLRDQLGGDWLRDEYFAGACRRRIKKDAPTTAAEAASVIEMLKKRTDYNHKRARS